MRVVTAIARAAKHRGFTVGFAVVLALVAAVIGWLFYLGTAPMEMTRSDARAFFAAVLAYIPLALIAIFVQGRSEERSLFEKQKSLEQAHARQVRMLLESERELGEMDGLAQTHADHFEDDEGTRILEALKSQHASIDAVRATLDTQGKTIDEISADVTAQARTFVSDVLLAGFGVLFALFGCLYPSRGGMFMTMLFAVLLTMQLIIAITNPVVDVMKGRTALVTVWVVGLTWIAAVFAAVGVVARVTIK